MPTHRETERGPQDSLNLDIIYIIDLKKIPVF